MSLLAGHEVSDLNSNRTVKDLYLDPLLAILDAHNRDWTAGNEKNWTGVYEDDPREEVTLFFDIVSFLLLYLPVIVADGNVLSLH